MAHLHRHAERFAPPPGFTREHIDTEDALQEWPAALRQGILSLAAAAIVAAAAERLRDEARSLSPTPTTFGLIHADLHPANLLVRHREVCAIDFGDCAFGYFAFDIAVWLVALAESGWPDLAEKRAAFLPATVPCGRCHRSRRPR
jgi:Ser/Thr protein kinase RdoA (MazF antagonist)